MSQKTDNMIKLALVFFVTLLSFAIGTYVGKKYSDNQHKLSLLEPKKNTPVPKAGEFASDIAVDAHDQINEAALPTEQQPAALTDSEVAKIAEEFASEEVATEQKLVATINPQEKELKVIHENQIKREPVNTVKPLQASQVISQASHAVKQGVTPTEKTMDARLPSSINPQAANTHLKQEITPILFTVQIGSYPNQSEAEKITQELQTKGFKTSFVAAKVNGQVWYRVNVGLFGTIKEAQDYKKEFLEKTKLSSAIVQRVLQ